MQFVKHHGKMFLVLFEGQRVYKDIVQVYVNESCNVFPEYHSHQPLEG